MKIVVCLSSEQNSLVVRKLIETQYIKDKDQLLMHTVIYIMEQQSNVNHHSSRHGTNSNSMMMPNSPLPTYNTSHMGPLSSQFPPRPVSSNAQRPPIPTSYTRPQSNFNSPRELALDQMARIVPSQQQHIRIDVPSNRPNNSSQQRRQRSFFTQYAGNSKPLGLGSSVTMQIEGHPNERNKLPKNPSIFYSYPQQESPQEGFKIEINNNRHNSSRQSKTDRDGPIKTSFVGGISNTPEAKGFPPQKYKFPTKNNKELDSTVNSSLKGIDKPDPVMDRQQSLLSKLSTRDSDTLTVPIFIPKKNSPTNFWPLSISPSEEKRQTLPTDQFTQEIEKNSHEMLSTNQFKKKKNFQFLRNLKRKTSVVINQPAKEFRLDDFELLDKIGKGAFGDVFLAQEKVTGLMVVLKKLQKKKIIEKKLEEQLIREIKIQSFLQHRHLTSIYGFFSDESCIYLILEVMPDGSLMQVRKKRKIQQFQASFYIRQICLGLKYMHTENVIHRDIKPENIFLNDNYVKIGDFGCSIFTQTNRNTQIGSFAYISPEQLKMESYNEKIDVWSVGVMTYEMLCGTSPFEADIIEIVKQQKAPQLSELKFPNNIPLSPEAKDFLIQMLDLNPKERLGIDEALRHEFIQKYIRSEHDGTIVRQAF